MYNESSHFQGARTVPARRRRPGDNMHPVFENLLYNNVRYVVRKTRQDCSRELSLLLTYGLDLELVDNIVQIIGFFL